MKIFKILKRSPSIRLFRTIYECPIWNWHQVRQTGDFRYLIRLEDYEHLPDVSTEPLEDVWLAMQDEFNEHFKDSSTGGYYYDKFVQYYQLLRDEVIYGCDAYNAKLSVTRTRRKQLEKELEKLPQKPQGVEEQAVMLEIFFQKDINTKTISVFRWYKYIEQYERRIEQIEKTKSNKAKSSIR